MGYGAWGMGYRVCGVGQSSEYRLQSGAFFVPIPQDANRALYWQRHEEQGRLKSVLRTMPDTPYPTPHTRHPTPDTRYPIPDTPHPTPDTRHPIPDTRHPIPDTRFFCGFFLDARPLTATLTTAPEGPVHLIFTSMRTHRSSKTAWREEESDGEEEHQRSQPA